VRAVELALALMAVPRGLDEVRARPLPPDMLALLKAAAGDAETLVAEASRYRSESSAVQEACATFAQQVLLLEGNDPFRVLGCAPEADDEQLRQHFRWLQRWLHPDRDPDGWVSVFADRVNAAWNVLKRADARERARLEADRPAAAARGGRRHPLLRGVSFPSPPDDRRPWWQYLPHAVVGGSLLLAAAVFWADRRFEGLPAIPDGKVLATGEPGPSLPAPPPPPDSEVATFAALDVPRPTPPGPGEPPHAAAPVSPAPTPEAPAAAPVAMLASTPPALPPITPAITATAAVAHPPQVPPVSVLLAYRGAYQRGDTAGLMRLFTADARTASGGWAQTRDHYAALFAATSERELILHDIVWRSDGEGWVGEGRLDVRLTKRQDWFRQYDEGPFTVRLQPRAGTHRIVAWEQGHRD